jgi:hypothetical protein
VRRKIGRRDAPRWAAVAALAAAGTLAVTGCGQNQLGAAALYHNHRISTATLAAEVANLNSGFQAHKHKLQIQYTQADMPRQVLTWMLRFATTDQIAKRTGITVTPAQAQKQLNDEKARAGQAGDTLDEAAIVNGLPPDLLPQLGRWIAIQLKLQDRLDNGVPPTTAAAQRVLQLKITRIQCLAAKSLNIKVNPQYGAYDYSQFAVVPATSKLAAAPGKQSASPAPQLTPKC